MTDKEINELLINALRQIAKIELQVHSLYTALADKHREIDLKLKAKGD